LGLGADHLRRRGIALRATLAAAAGVALLAQLMLVVRAPLPAWLPWIIIAGIGAATVLSYAILGELFPKSASARANGALNLLHVGAACALQYGIGLIIQQWPAEAGHYAPIAYQTALGLNLVLQMAAFFWFVRPERRPMFRRFAAHPIHALAARFGLGPPAAMPYALARQVWGTRLNDAHGQARAWRCAALASLALLMLTGLSVGTTLVGGSILIHVRQVTEVSHVR
jgi:hypothetical protein